LDEDELTPEEVIALAETFPVGPPSETLLRMAKFPAYAIPAAGYRTSLEFWSAVAEQVAAGVMRDGRRALLAAARRKFPYSTKFPDPPAGAVRGATVAPLRVLVIGASPSDPDLPYIRADREAHVIDKEARQGRVEVTYVLGAEATDMENVRSFRPNILHFVCHGEGDCLVFNDTRGEADPVQAGRIVHLLRHYRDADGVRLRAIVLAACDGETLAPNFTQVADTVIAHSGKLADPCGEAFARQLYRLLNDGTRDVADPHDLAAAAREAAQLAAQFCAGCAPVIDNLIVLPAGT